MDCIEKYSGLLIAFFTFCLVVVAWIQVNKFINQVRADFLYKITLTFFSGSTSTKKLETGFLKQKKCLLKKNMSLGN
jgi:hypothetical protein